MNKMTSIINLQDLVNHLVNGSLEENICQICLMPLGDKYENVNSILWTEGKTYCIADVLQQVCDIKVSNKEQYKICSACFLAARQAYKFYLTAQNSQEIVDFYVNEITNQLHSTCLAEFQSNALCITLPVAVTEVEKQTASALHNLNKDTIHRMKTKREVSTERNDDLIMILNENGEHLFFKAQNDGTLALVDKRNVYLKDYLNGTPDSNANKSNIKMSSNIQINQISDCNAKIPDAYVRNKKGRKRNLMAYKRCSQCPVRYRFVRKLKEHMKQAHSIDLFVCQICQTLIEGDKEFTKHLQTHAGIHACSVCNMVFKKRKSIIAHLRWHDRVKAISQSDGAHVCEVCGLIFRDGEDLKAHHDKKHVKKFTCYYCGRMYKGELSFDLHIKKHELNDAKNVKQDQGKPISDIARRRRKFPCSICSRDFVDERSRLWHERLHTDERPYVCDVCGRGFVSLNRRNQHAVCAHTTPTRRCPLCPALFHLRSMVNTHVKKVHLKAHKRPNRASKHQNVFWKTEPVPIQELSVSIQNDILELQAKQTQANQELLW